MLFATATTVLVVVATLIAAIPFIHADRQQRRRCRALQDTRTQKPQPQAQLQVQAKRADVKRAQIKGDQVKHVKRARVS
jgi:hypothetical protein